jgi:hypothetical protein
VNRARYETKLKLLGVEINEVIIDPHYKINHLYMEDWIILELVKRITKEKLIQQSENENYQYYVFEPIVYNQKPYRLVVVLETGCNYLGIINTFRVKEKKNGISIR